ncbi:MAG: DUF2778 domain-containing protein [Hyphomicrobiales bacterium]|nr:DUF2778 domain-containing protein [Hyphomicrobiales bacterium]
MAVSAAALLSLSCVGARLIAHKLASEAVVAAPAAKSAAPPAEAAANFGALIVEPQWAAKAPSPGNVAASSVASLDAAPSAHIPLPSLDAFPPARPAQAAPANDDTSSVASLETAPSASIPLPSLGTFPPARGAEAVPSPPVASAPPPESEVARLEDSVPLPPARPPGLGEETRPALPRLVAPIAPAPPVDNRNVFQKLFGWALPSAPRTPSAAWTQATPGTQVASIAPESRAALRAPAPPPPPAVASAPPPGGRGGGGWFGFGAPSAPQSYDRQTAVYDISSHTVYMPDGARLEAHSGLGDRLDDPRYVSERARGATPPHLYELTLRESLFHGVQALRMSPIGEGGVYGRAGLLVHTYMLGPNGDSNGCVSVRDYDAFLRAYESGEIKRLMVVSSRNQFFASAEPQSGTSAR